MTKIIMDLMNVIKEESPEINGKAVKKEAKRRFINRVDSSFNCIKNTDVVIFLRDKAFDSELHHLTRTYLYTLNEEWLGFSTISLKVLQIGALELAVKKKLIASSKSPKNTTEIPAYLVAQVAKNDSCSMEEFCASDMLTHAIQEIDNARGIVGGKIVILDSVNVDKVIEKYESFGFMKYGELFNGPQWLQPMFLDISKQ
ncbi:hypothetical protein HB943_13195 [Listeria weihenstephanensis]|uniref:Uncharacterized protein n=1 Tax=Listeria weihenstephanensis TaxID=1006155 RepID=A0A841Z9L2_9LIST|nr:hypothetical protein [Listeria weihenstephanensis]MBC1501559.1 hypothetical protein [Listeria weihenstephanensis]